MVNMNSRWPRSAAVVLLLVLWCPSTLGQGDEIPAPDAPAPAPDAPAPAPAPDAPAPAPDAPAPTPDAPAPDAPAPDAPAPDAPPPAPETPAPTLPPVECHDNTTTLYDYMAAKDPFQFEEFVLCPDTLYELGVIPGPSATCCIDGMSPIAARANSKLKCGKDGKSSNNCVLTSGQFQVISSFFTFFEYSNNIEFEGITFESSNFAALLLENDGDIVFRDCVFQKHTAIAPIISAYRGPIEVRRLHESVEDLKNMGPRERMAVAMNERAKKLQGKPSLHDELEPHQRQLLQEHDQGNRKLQATQTLRQKTTFVNCTFQDNERGMQGGAEKFGVITIEGIADDLIVENTLFQHNLYGDPEDVKGYIVQYTQVTDSGHSLEMTDSCFLDNDLIGAGALLLPSDDILKKNEGNYASADDDLKCPFAAVVVGTETTCVDSTADVCSITGTTGENDGMAPAPTPEDNGAPSPIVPTDGPPSSITESSDPDSSGTSLSIGWMATALSVLAASFLGFAML